MRVHKFGLETPMELDEIEDAWAGEGEVNFAEVSGAYRRARGGYCY